MLGMFPLILLWVVSVTWRRFGAGVVFSVVMIEPAAALAAMTVLSLLLSVVTRKRRWVFRSGWAAMVWGAAAGAGIIFFDFRGTMAWHAVVALIAAVFLVHRMETANAVGLNQWFFRRIVAWGVGLLLYVGTGYLSAVASRHACEMQLARHITVDVMRGAPFHGRSGESPEHDRIFIDAGIVRLPPGVGPDEYPCASADKAIVVMPFVVSGEYGWWFGSTYGEGRRRMYIGVFGLAFEISDDMIWIS
jgi:hypothetical protein